MQFSKQKKTYQAYGYVRLSQDDEDKIQESDSISNQKLLIKEYAAKHKVLHLTEKDLMNSWRLFAQANVIVSS